VAVTEETFAGTIHGFLRALGHVAAADRAARQGGEWLKARFA
jgi:acetyl esterase